MKPSRLICFFTHIRSFTRHRSAENPSQRKALCSVITAFTDYLCKGEKGENFPIIELTNGQENSHDFWFPSSNYEPVLFSTAMPASCSLTFTLWGRGKCKDVASGWPCTQIDQLCFCQHYTFSPLHRGFLPCLKILYSGKHIKMPCWVLLYHILYIIRPQCLLEFFFIKTKL